ncbi:MAG TPA: hypothetical protein VK555_11885 [Terriglobales bacterium]|jgi:hypothetical protein|nr:hypothetical protein [Terriglobales bacterium]
MSHVLRIPVVIVLGLCTVNLLYSQSNETKQNSADLLRTFKTIYVQSKTLLAKPQMLAGELQKNAKFDSWGLSITSNPGADVVVEIDHQPGWFYYTYAMTDQSSSIVLAVGRVNAWDGKQASAKIAREIIKRIAIVRNPPTQH